MAGVVPISTTRLVEEAHVALSLAGVEGRVAPTARGVLITITGLTTEISTARLPRPRHRRRLRRAVVAVVVVQLCKNR